MKNTFLVTIIILLSAILFTLAASSTTASINVVHTWTALQNFAAGSTVPTPADADNSTLIATTGFVVPDVLTSTTGPVSDPGGTFAFLYNNASGALTYNAPAGVKGLERCYRNYTGKSGVITIQLAASNTIDITGVNGSAAGTVVSGGALGDQFCMNSDATNHWFGNIVSGSWVGN